MSAAYNEVCDEMRERGFVLKDGVWRWNWARVNNDALRDLVASFGKDAAIDTLPPGDDAVTKLGKLASDA